MYTPTRVNTDEIRHLVIVEVLGAAQASKPLATACTGAGAGAGGGGGAGLHPASNAPRARTTISSVRFTTAADRNECRICCTVASESWYVSVALTPAVGKVTSSWDVVPPAATWAWRPFTVCADIAAGAGAPPKLALLPATGSTSSASARPRSPDGQTMSAPG